MMITLILPCCGDSSRFPGTRPKYLLTHPNGKSMLKMSINALNLREVDRIVVAIRRDHLQKYDFLQGLEQQFDKRLEWCVIEEPTKSQPETVAKTIEQKNILGQIAIKDSDNTFKCVVGHGNYVATSTLQEHILINPSNKSYVERDGQFVERIAEKEVISDTFCCGLYGFKDAEQFVNAYHYAKNELGSVNVYVSDVINALINYNYGQFTTLPVYDYVDWGTAVDWNRYKEQFETLFIDLDGVLVENSGEYLRPKWGTTDAIQKNVDFLRRKHKSGKVMIIITTSRSNDAKSVTYHQLDQLGIPYDRVIFGLPHARRVVINDYAPSNPYPSCYAVNLPRNAPILGDLMK